MTSHELSKYLCNYKEAKFLHRKLVRRSLAEDAIKRDEDLLKDPKSTYRRIRNSRRNQAGKVHKLRVADRTYIGDRVPDGFYDSVKQLKTKNKSLQR